MQTVENATPMPREDDPRWCRFRFYCKCGHERSGVERIHEVYRVRARFASDHAGPVHSWGERIADVKAPR